MAKPSLFLTTEDPYAIYGPGEKVRGTANLDLVTPVLAKYIIVSLLVGSRISPTGVKAVKQTFIHKQFKVPFHNKREDPTRSLSAGKHKWDFEFSLPAANNLPPSFIYRDQDGTAEIMYCLVMCVYKSSSAGPTKENMCTTPIKYSPKRSPAIIIDGSLAQLCQSLFVKRVDEPPFQGRRRVRLPRMIKSVLGRRKLEQERFHVTLWLPRYAAFTNHMDISLKVETENEDPLHIVEVRLMKVEYRLSAITRITHERIPRMQRHHIQGNTCNCSTILEINSHWMSLRRHAPFRVQPRIHGMPLDKNTFSTLGPSFGSNHIVREYSLDVDLFLSVNGKTHRIRFENNELILLPDEMHLTAT